MLIVISVQTLIATAVAVSTSVVLATAAAVLAAVHTFHKTSQAPLKTMKTTKVI